jgi:hypothetical protein
MADPLDVLLRRCCVSVDGRGTGFFVAPRYVLTCSHVVRDEVKVGDPTELVAAIDNHRYPARLACRFPDDDLAILETVTEFESAAILGSSEAELCGEEKLLIVGYPQYQQSLLELGGLFVVYDGFTDAGVKRRLQFRGNQVVPGFSGSPLLNLHTGHVLGIVAETRGRTSALGGWAVPVETISARLRECRAEITSNIANLRAWNTALEDRQDNLGSSVQFRQPELRKFDFGTQNFLSLASHTTELLGRQAEMKALEDFLESPLQFAWMPMTGPGGVGKSRLALELCLRHADTWRAGFVTLGNIQDSKFWFEWRPSRPTLLVVDSAGGIADSLGEVIRMLGSRKLSPPFPVRMLLIEREIKRDLPVAGAESLDWFHRFLGKDVYDREATLAVQFPFPNATEIQLGALSDDDNWAIIHYLAPDRFGPSDREQALAWLRRIDPECRALFAIFLAKCPEGADKVEIVRQLLMDEQSRWSKAGINAADLMLLACATLCGGAARALFANHSSRLDLAVQTFSAARYEAMSAKSAKSSLAPLEPDILGEVFVLDWLLNADDADGASIVSAAWSANAPGVAGFLYSTVPEFPEHPAIETLLKPPSGPIEPICKWASALVELTREMPWRYERLGVLMHDAVKSVASAHPGQVELYELDCRATLNFMLLYERGRATARASSLETELYAMIAKHPHPTSAKALKAHLLGNQVVRITKSIEDQLALPLLPAPLTFVDAMSHAKDAQKIFDELNSLSKRGASNDDFKSQYAAAAFHLILGYTKPAHVFSRIRSPVAAALVKKDVIEQLRFGQNAYLNLKKFASNNFQLQVQSLTARAASALSAGYANLNDAKAVKRLCDDLKAMSTRSPNEPDVRAEYARALFNLVFVLETVGEHDAAAVACAGLRTLCQEHPAEGFIRERLERAERVIGRGTHDRDI